MRNLNVVYILHALVATMTTFAVETPAPKLKSDEQTLVDLTNRERQKAGLQPLAVNEKLMAAARQHTANMARQKILSHELDGKKPEDRIKEQPYEYFEVGENVAWNDPNSEAAVNAWMYSPPHRANILRKDFTEIGVGIARDDAGQPYYTQDFGRPRSAGPTTVANFTIVNKSNEDLLITLGTSGSAAMLRPGQEGSFSMAGVGELPPVKIELGDTTRELKPVDGARYVINGNEQAINVSSEPSTEQTQH